MACPLVRTVGAVLGWVDRQIIGLLSLDPNRYNNEQLREAWQVIRNLAYIILIPIMLIMVIGTAVGLNFVSAYTVKAALPRMIIATIFITLSFDIMVFAVDLVQAVGVGIQNIILHPFGLNSEATLDRIIPPTVGGAMADWGILGALFGAGVVGAIGVGGGMALIWTVLGIFGTLTLWLLVVFMLLLLRQVLIIMLILVAPLAILLWIFPGKNTLFGLWSKTLWALLLFFPVAMAVIGVGKAMASVVVQ